MKGKLPPAQQALADRMFEAWCFAPHGQFALPYNEETSALYRLFWGKWCSFLAGRRVRPDRAAAIDVEAFLRDKPTQTTQARNRRLLRRIYELAALTDVVKTNPVDGILDDNIARREAPSSVSMTPAERLAVLELLRRPGDDPCERRDRLLVALCLADGLTLAEARFTRRRDVGFGPAPKRHPKTLHIPNLSARRDAQARTLDLEPITIDALQDLLSRDPPLPPDEWLLRPMNLDRGQAMGRIAGFQAAQNFMKTRAMALLKREPADLGPTMLRNSALRAWLESDMALPEVQRRAGFARLDTLDRISVALGQAARDRFERRKRVEQAVGFPSGERHRARYNAKRDDKE